MSNRFHNKWHRTNHHTYTNANNPDAGHDPIASKLQPFLGDFVLSGALSAVAPLSAYAAYLYSNNIALCALGGKVAGLFFSNGISLSTGGGGVNLFNSRTGIYTIPTNRTLNGAIYVPVLDVKGNTYLDGNLAITGDLSAFGNISYLDTKVILTSSFYVENKGLDAAATIIQTGNFPVLVCYDKDVGLGVPSFIVDGANAGNVGINTTTPTEKLTIVGNITGYHDKVAFNRSIASGTNSFSTGTSQALGNWSSATNNESVANGPYSHAEGYRTTTGVSADASHAEGANTTASGRKSHAEGEATVASGENSHAEGVLTTASGNTSHAAGYRANTGNYCYVWSDGQLATQTTPTSSTRTGQYLVSASSNVFIPGKMSIGTDSIENALTVVGNVSTRGNLTVFGNVSASGNTILGPLSTLGNLTVFGNVSASGNTTLGNVNTLGNLTVFGNVSASGNLIVINSLTANAFFGNTLTFPVSTGQNLTANSTIVLDFLNNSYVICPLAQGVSNTTFFAISNMQPGRTMKVLLSAQTPHSQLINIDSRFRFFGSTPRPTSVGAYSCGLLQLDSFGYQLSSVALTYTPQT